MKSTELELQDTPSARSASGIDEAALFSTVIHDPSVCVIDFFDEHDRLEAGLEASSKKFAIKRQNSNVATRLNPSLGLIDRLEESLYWLLSATTLIYLVCLIIGS